jgi:rod shape-determining protein MreC
VVVIAQVVAMAARAPLVAEGGDGVERFGLRMVAPLGAVVDAGAGIGAALASSLQTPRDLRRENDALRREVERQRIELLRRQSLEEEIQRLAAAVDFDRAHGGALRFHVAEVLYVDHASWLRTMLVRAPGARPRQNQAAVSTGGVVGRVVAASAEFARVQLILDRSSSIGAELERTERQGVVRGDGEGGLVMDFVPRQVDVRPGDRVLTAGIDGVYPPGLEVGTVTAVGPGDDQLFHRIALAPAADFGGLGAVYLLDRPAPPPELTAETEGDGEGRGGP